MSHRTPILLLPLVALLTQSCRESNASPAAVTTPSDQATVSIQIDPYTTRSIGGESELDRKRYFAICDAGDGFEKRVRSAERYDQLVHREQINFGRLLGPIRSAKWAKGAIQEDPQRPGFADIDHLRDSYTKRSKLQQNRLQKDFGPNLDVASHGSPNSFPDFMGSWTSEHLKSQTETGGHGIVRLPKNIEAAAELSAAVFKYAFSDLTRPRYYEPINEPHWSYLTDPSKLAAWHLATMGRMHEQVPGVQVGGPCNSVGYFYSKNYHSFNSFRSFIDATSGSLDFYSFHVYDYHQWNGKEFTGAILSGLPLEGVLDLVPNYTQLKYQHETPIVISEHGGYSNEITTKDESNLLASLASERIPGSGFEWEMKARSIHDFIHVDSIIANTLVFMEHPHTVKKAVPFILLETSAWDPRYYAALYAKKDFNPRSREWAPSSLHYFYQLFRDIKGHRVQATCDDPDIQLRSFVDGSRMFIIAHNLSDQDEVLDINTPAPEKFQIRRYGRNPDLTPYLAEEQGHSLATLPLRARETMVVIADYSEAIPSKRTLEEAIHYGSSITVPVESGTSISVPVPDSEAVEFATLRIGFNRPADTGKEINLKLNGTTIPLPTEDSAPRYTNEKHGYSSTRIVHLDPALLKDENQLEIAFPDGKPGTIGSAVIRASRPAKPTR